MTYIFYSVSYTGQMNSKYLLIVVFLSSCLKTTSDSYLVIEMNSLKIDNVLPVQDRMILFKERKKQKKQFFKKIFSYKL